MGFFSLFLLTAAAPNLGSCVPVRWPFPDQASLELLREAPVNCLLLEPEHWNGGFLTAAQSKGLKILAVMPAGSGNDIASRMLALPFDGVVVEGDQPLAVASPRPVISLPNRSGIPLDLPAPVLGTTQGLWPGIRLQKDGAVVAAPTGAPWIETNTGFLRFVRSIVPAESVLWIANKPPDGSAFGPERYVQAVADAAMSGARWVIAFDPWFAAGLQAGDAKAVSGWKRILSAVRFYEEHKEFCKWPDWSTLGLVQDRISGALYSGGFLDMIAARHIPATVIPPARLMTASVPQLRLLLNIDPGSLDDAQKEKIRQYARQGSTVVNGPPGWRIASGETGQVAFSGQQVKQVEDAWREINGLIGRRNFGVRIFGVPGMLSNLTASPDGDRLALHLVNYTSYPVESITVHALGRFTAAALLTPKGRRHLETYEVEDGTGIDIPKVEDVAILLLQRSRMPDQPNR